MRTRHYLEDPAGGPRAVELVQDGVRVVRRFGRPGDLARTRSQTYPDVERAAQDVARWVRNLTVRGYRLGHHEPGLVERIREEGDPAYLVYADWLAEREDPRAELITVQTALESRPADPALRAREAELLAEHIHAFVPAGDLAPFEWHRGFLRGVHLSVVDWWDRDPETHERHAEQRLARVARHPSGAFLERATLVVIRRRQPAVERVASISHGPAGLSFTWSSPGRTGGS
ncbi:MAG: TIGR02996 domain-containing protein [Alphaproteobacteria bacterium]|nr:TIGR02996 domain-containing protein [Alphaproteobacteria bacterium]